MHLMRPSSSAIAGERSLDASSHDPPKPAGEETEAPQCSRVCGREAPSKMRVLNCVTGDLLQSRIGSRMTCRRAWCAQSAPAICRAYHARRRACNASLVGKSGSRSRNIMHKQSQAQLSGTAECVQHYAAPVPVNKSDPPA